MNRTFDPVRVNYLVNHPDVRPFIGGDPAEPLDLSAAVANDENIFLDGEHGGFACIWSAPGVYEIHTFVLPEGRGEWAVKFAAWGIAFLVENGAHHLWTRILPEAGNVRAFAIKMGMKPAGRQTLDLGTGPTIYDLFDWRA